MDDDFPTFRKPEATLSIDKYGSTFSWKKLIDAPESPPEPYPYLKDLFDGAEKPADSVYVAPEDIGMIATAKDIFGMNVIVSDLVAPGTAILANAPALKPEMPGTDPYGYEGFFTRNQENLATKLAASIAAQDPRSVIRITGVESGSSPTVREQRQWVERRKRRQPRLLDDRNRGGAQRWGLSEYGRTFRTRREAIRAIRKGRT